MLADRQEGKRDKQQRHVVKGEKERGSEKRKVLALEVRERAEQRE